MLSRKTAFNSEEPIVETALSGDAADTERETAIDELINRGLLEKGRGGYRVGLRTEVLLRLLGVLLRTTGKPGVTSCASFYE